MFMTQNSFQDEYLPVKGNISLIYILSILLAILMMVASIAGLLFPVLTYPTGDLVRSFVPNDLVNLVIGLPILLGSMWIAWRGRLVGLLLWPGSLFFVFYNYTAYVFAMPLNWVFPFHLVLAILSVYALIGLVGTINADAVCKRLSGAVNEKLAGGILMVLGLLFSLRVMGVLITAIVSGVLPLKTDLAVNISDFVITPAWMVGGALLWRRKPFGYVAGLGLLFQGSMLFIALIVFLLVQPFLTSVPFAIVDVLAIFVMGLVCFIPFVLFVRGVVKSSINSSIVGDRA
jgi:hypothetical protein